MSRIKSYLLGFVTFYTTITAYGQTQITKPVVCTTPPPGIQLGGDFLSPGTACLDYTSGSSLVRIQNPRLNATTNFTIGTVNFNFNYKDSDGPLTFPNPADDKHTYTVPGTYWIVMVGKVGSDNYIQCKSIEIFPTPKAKITYNNCNGNAVTVTLLNHPDNNVYNGYQVNWGDGVIERQPFTSIPATGIVLNHTYVNTPTSTPQIQGAHYRSGIINCLGEAYEFLINSNVDPKISELEGLAGGNENKITMKGGNPGQDYNIEMKTGTGAWTATGQKITAPAASATATATITGLNGANEYCFRLQQPGACASQITSNEVCTIKPTHRVLSPKEVKVDWTTAQTGINRFQIPYKEFPSSYSPNSGTTSPSIMTYTFDRMSCGTKYEFRVIGYVGTLPDRIEIKSPTFIVDPATGGRLPNSIIGIASVTDNTVRLNMFSTLTINKYNIYRSEGNSTNFQPLTSVTENAYVDRAVQQDKQQYCYKVDYEDECGNKSALSDPFCTIFLTSAEANTINWTPFSVVGSPTVLQNVQPTEYTIQILDNTGSVMSTLSNTFDTMADVKDALDRLLNDPTLNGRVTFRILARQDTEIITDTGPLFFPFYSYSNNYTFITPALIYVPSAFTPNMDTVNDSFKATGKFIAEFNMVIYNRWGAPIFESRDIEKGWDGNDNGQPAPAGSYGYKIFGIDNAGQEFSKVGSVLLLK